MHIFHPAVHFNTERHTQIHLHRSAQFIRPLSFSNRRTGVRAMKGKKKKKDKRKKEARDKRKERKKRTLGLNGTFKIIICENHRQPASTRTRMRR